MSDAEKLAAAEALADCWDSYTLGDIATALTCTEAEAMAQFMRAFGYSADGFLREHGEGDDCGDQHCQCEDCLDGVERDEE